MLRNYISVALRNLVANKLYSLINIGGLAFGLAACLLILLHVKDELSYDRWLPNADRIASVETTFMVPGREKMGFAGTPGPTKAALEKDFSSDIVRVVRVFGGEEPIRAGDRQFLGGVTYVDAGYFEVFDLPMIAGVREAALANNASILLSQTAARKYFGDQPAVGQTITASGTTVFTVVGVFADIPRNSHFDTEIIGLFDPERYKDNPSIAERWTSVNLRIYALFRSVAAMQRVASEMPAFIDRNVKFEVPGFNEAPSKYMQLHLMPVEDIHLHATKQGYQNQGSLGAVLGFGGIALLILIIACINFVNLATARAMKRAREVAMRKVVGATRGQLVRQHLGEAVITTLIALVVAIALVQLALVPFNAFLNKDLHLDLFGDPVLVLVTIGLVVVVGVIGGLYPAIYLSRFRPATVLKANQSSAHGSSLLRSGLVVFQFAISIALIACTATIYSQTMYARTLDLGFDRGDRIKVNALSNLPTPDAVETLKREVGALPGVRGVGLSSDGPPLHGNNNTLLYPTPTVSEERLVIEVLDVDADFFAVYGVAPVAGRLFSAEHATDYMPAEDATTDRKQSIVINRAFAAMLGAKRPEDVIGKVLYEVSDDDKPMTVTTVIGVVPDLYLRSVRSMVTPLLYRASRAGKDFELLTVQVAPGKMQDTVRAIDAVWARLAPSVPLNTTFVDADLDKLYDGDEQRARIFAGFAVFAVLIACLGLFGLASFSAERRTKEIGLRKVMGASVSEIVRLLVWQFSRPVLIANLIAWPVAYYVMQRWLAGFQYKIDLTSPVYLIGIFGGAALLSLVIAWFTTAGHAYRVARSNPGRALRVE